MGGLAILLLVMVFRQQKLKDRLRESSELQQKTEARLNKELEQATISAKKSSEYRHKPQELKEKQ